MVCKVRVAARCPISRAVDPGDQEAGTLSTPLWLSQQSPLFLWVDLHTGLSPFKFRVQGLCTVWSSEALLYVWSLYAMSCLFHFPRPLQLPRSLPDPEPLGKSQACTLLDSQAHV